MNQAEHSEKQRRKILDTSYKLFLKDGYTKTTVRKIITETGLTTGTLYHFFKNKDDILATLMNEGFNDTIRIVDRITKKYNDPVLRYAVEIAVITLPIYTNRKIASLYFVFYTAPESSKMMIEKAVQRAQAWFKEINPELKYSECYMRVLSLKGFIQSFLSEKIHGDFHPGYLELYQFIAEIFLNSLDIPSDKVTETIKKAMKILGKNNIEMFGHNSDKIIHNSKKTPAHIT